MSMPDCLLRCLTGRKEAEAKTARLSMLYSALSECNRVMIRSASVEELLQNICRNLVEQGNMKMVWVAWLDPATGQVYPAAAYGDGQDYLTDLKVNINSDNPLGRGPVGTAIRDQKPVWCQDFQTDPSTAPWHDRASRFGWKSCAAIPLQVRKKTIGALTLYSEMTNVFEPDLRDLFVGMSDDISFALENLARLDELKKKDRAERESGERFRHIFEQIPSVAIQGYTAEGVTQYWNQASEQLYGYTAEEAIGRNLLDLVIPPELRLDVTQAIQSMNEKGEPIPPAELSLQCKDGSRVTVFSSHALLTLPDRSTEFFCVDIDLTKLKQAEALLRLQGGALEAAANAIVITNFEGVIEWVNPAFTRFTGYEAAEVIGQTPSLLQSGQHDQAFYQKLWDTIKAGQVWNGEMTNRRKDGTLYTEEMSVTPVINQEGVITHFIAIKQDVTERKQMQEMVLRTQRMESVGRLASGLAHDLNNILSPILLSSGLLRLVELSAEREELIATIESCARRGAAIIKQVLTFARGSQGALQALQLNPIVEEVGRMLHETFRRDIVCTVFIADQLGLVQGDSTQIHQVLLNLCLNAQDAMAEGGELLLSATNITLDEKNTENQSEAKVGDYVRLSITDTGPGISPTHLEKIFDPFFTTKEVGKGTGLGLSTVLGIVRGHGGFVTVESQVGKGTTFQVFLPQYAGDMMEPKPLVPRDMLQGQQETILVVDDEADILKFIALVLNRAGYRTLTATEGVEALLLYQKQSHEIALVLTDVMMPKMDGVKLIQALQKINPKVNVIASTGQTTAAYQNELRDLGVSAILQKPYENDQLLTLLHEALHRKQA